MNDELKRIRAKDFSQLDEKIFEDQTRADTLQVAVSSLSDFQRFLMEQISQINKEQPSANSNLIAKSIARNFDHLKESLAKCSRIQERTEKAKLQHLRDHLHSLKEELKQAKLTIAQQVKEVGAKNQEIVQALVSDVVGKLEGQKKKNEDLSIRFKQIVIQNEKLRKQNQQLKLNSIQQQKESLNIEKVECIPSKIYTESNYRTPLKQTELLGKAKSNFVVKEEGWKVTRNQIAEGLHQESMEKRNSSLKRQTSNHQLSRKSHINCLRDKENENIILKSKGVAMQDLKRGKSKQKIKLFSMI